MYKKYGYGSGYGYRHTDQYGSSVIDNVMPHVLAANRVALMDAGRERCCCLLTGLL